MSDFRVKLMAVTEDPQLIAAAGALGCSEEDASYEILEKLLALSPEERDKKSKSVLKNSFGMGHGSIGDQCCFIFSIKDLPRAATLQLCLPEFMAHLQQSLRRAKPERGFHMPMVFRDLSFSGAEVIKVLEESFRFYSEMAGAGIPAEDARYLLPLYTRTNIQTAVNARELCHLWTMSNQDGVPSVTKAVVQEMMSLAKKEAPYLFENFGANYEILAWFPSSQLFAKNNETMKRLIDRYVTEDRRVLLLNWLMNEMINRKTIREAIQNRNEAELANLKHIHFEFLAPMSLACFHQATRQRTWNQSVESIYDAAFRDLEKPLSRMFIPESVKKSEFVNRYEVLHRKMMKLYGSLVEKRIPMSEAIGVVPHSLMIYDWIHVNGWNAIHAIGKRTCTKAQLEIRRIAWTMARQIRKAAPIFGGFVEPQCITYGKCPEKEPCDYVERKKKKK